MIGRCRSDEPVNPVIRSDQVFDAVKCITRSGAATGDVCFKIDQQLERAFLAVIHRIIASAAPENVDPVLTAQHVVALAAVKNIVALTAQNDVIAPPAIQRVVAIIAFGLIRQIGHVDGVVDVATGQ